MACRETTAQAGISIIPQVAPGVVGHAEAAEGARLQLAEAMYPATFQVHVDISKTSGTASHLPLGEVAREYTTAKVNTASRPRIAPGAGAEGHTEAAAEARL